MDAPRKSLAGALTCFLFSLGIGASTALADEPRPQDCTTFSDFSDELTLSNIQVTGQSVAGGGWVDVEIGADVTNHDVGDFVRIVGTPLLEGTGLVVASDPPLEPWRFDDVGPGAGPVASATPLRLRLQLTDLPTLLAGLASGDLHVTLGAEERLKLKPGVTLHYWDPFDAFFFFDPPVPGLTLQWEDPLNGDMPPPVLAAFDAAGPKFYATVDPQGFVPDFLPSDRRHLKVFAHGHTIPPPVYLHDLIDVPFEYAGSDSPTELFESGTLCSGVDQSYGFDTHRTGEPLINGEAPPENGQEPEGSHIQPVEFAGVSFANGAVTVSGQLAVHAARPRVEFRIRPTRTKITVDLELDMSMAAALEASRQVTLAPEERTILDVCLPLPPIPAGPVQIPMALEFSHRVSASASFTAAAAIGFEKAVTAGVRMIHDSARPVGDQLTVERRSTPSPIEFSPPRFARDAEAHARVATDLVTSILIGDCSPGSLLGAAGHLRASAYGTFDAQLGGTPNWSLGHGESLSAGFSFDALGFDVAAVDLPPLDFPGTASRSEPTTATEAFAGEDVRWGVSIDDLDAVNAMETAAVAATADGGAAVVTYANDNATNQLVRLDRFGSYLWHRKFKLGRTPSHVIAMPDDGLIVAGAINHANDHWVARLDASGNVLWARDASVGDPANATILGSCALRDIAALRDGGGVVTGFVVAGEVLGNPVTTSDACLVRLDADGNVVWGKIYRDADRQRFNAVTPTADGGFVAVGFTTYGSGSVVYEDNGMVVRVDADGNLLWAHAVLEDWRRVGELRAVVEADDGRIFFAGGAQGPITNTGSLLVGRLDADGGNPKLHIVFGEDRPIGLPPTVRESPFDVGFDMTPVPGGIVVVGRQGLQVNPSPAVGPDVVAAWAFEMDTQLGIEWMTMFDGPWTDGFQGVARTANGFLVTGVSQSFLPLGTGFAEKSLAVMHLPFEGLLSFLPATNARATVLRPWTLLQMSAAGASVAQPLTVIDAVHRSTTPIVGLLVTPPRVCVTPLTRAGHDSVLDACDLDLDADGVDEPRDNCAGTTNADQADVDGDGVGDACDPPLCGNGVVELGEACDDGNLDDADGCESGCVPTSQCAQVVALTEAKIVVKKLGSPAGDETITFAGRLAVPNGVPLDPIASGLQVAIEDLGVPGAFLLDLTERTLPVPGGALAPSPCDPSANPRKAKQDGWERNKAGTAFTYRNQTGALPAAGCAAGSARGLRKVTLTDQRGRRGYVRFKLEVNPTTLNVVQGPLVGSLVLTAGPAVGGGPCGSTDLPWDACRLNARATTMTCD